MDVNGVSKVVLLIGRLKGVFKRDSARGIADGNDVSEAVLIFERLSKVMEGMLFALMVAQ